MKVRALLPLDEVAVGMRVAGPVADAGGHLLVQAGTEVSESLLQGLQRRGIAAVEIEQDIAENPEQLAMRRAEISVQLDQRFRKAGDGAETRLLYQAILDYRLESGA